MKKAESIEPLAITRVRLAQLNTEIAAIENIIAHYSHVLGSLNNSLSKLQAERIKIIQSAPEPKEGG